MQFHCLSSSVEVRAANPPRFWGRHFLRLSVKAFFHHRQHSCVASCDAAAGGGSCAMTPLTPGGKHQGILLSFEPPGAVFQAPFWVVGEEEEEERGRIVQQWHHRLGAGRGQADHSTSGWNHTALKAFLAASCCLHLCFIKDQRQQFCGTKEERNQPRPFANQICAGSKESSWELKHLFHTARQKVHWWMSAWI